MKFTLKMPWRAADPATTGQDDVLLADPDAPREALVAGSVDPEPSEPTRLYDRKRIFRVVSLLFIAWTAGQLVQIVAPDQVTRQAQADQEPLGVETAQAEVVLSAQAIGTEMEGVAAPAAEAVVTFAATPDATPTTPVPAETAMPEIQLAALAPVVETPEPAAPSEPAVVLAAATPELPTDAVAAITEGAPVAETCPVTLDLSPMPGALLSVVLTAPCAPNARVVLRHEGLSITGVTTETGALFTSLPALTTTAHVTAMLSGGEVVTASLEVPQAAAYRRFAVQWQGDDAFQINAYENGAAYGQLGHVSELQPKSASDAGSFLQIFGDPEAVMPLLAEVYTFPIAATLVELELEAAVTAATCGREMIGETLFSDAGQVTLTDLTLAMPDCSAIGDFLVLNNLVPDVTLATN